MAKKTAKKSAAPKPAKIEPAKKVRTKGEVYTTLAGQMGLKRQQVSQMFEVMGKMIEADLDKGCGVFAVPGLMKITVIRKPATKQATKPNPFKPGEMMVVKAKPARNVVKIRALKGLKQMV